MKKLFSSSLTKNSLYLYILLLSNYVFNFITIPYQTRIMGPEIYGKLGLSMAIMIYFSLIIDYGFILSATEEVATNSKDVVYIGKVLTAITIIKLVLIILSFFVLLLMINNFQVFEGQSVLYIIMFFAVCSGSFLPDYIYRGIEKMKSISIRSVFVRFIFVILVFSFLKTPDNYLVVPLSLLIVNLLANAFAYLHLRKVEKIQFQKVDYDFIKVRLMMSTKFFLSRIASTIYTATNTVVIGLIYPKGSPMVGYFTSSDKIISTGKSAISPIADSLYPYMIINKNYKLIKKMLLIATPVVIIGVIMVMVFSTQITILLFGNDFAGGGGILRYLMPILVLTPFIYLLGFPMLGPMKLSKHANYSVILAAFFHVLGLLFIYLFYDLNVYSIAILTFMSEFVILIYRIIVIYINRNILREGV